MFALYKHVLTLLPRYTFRNSVKILGKNRKFQTDQYLEFHEQNKHMYDLKRKDFSTNFSFFLLSRDEKEKSSAMSSTKLHRDAIMVTEVTRETTRDGGREVKTETILSKRILRAQVSSAFATKRKCARRGNQRNNWRTRRCTADRVPLFRLTGITALEHHGLLSLSSLFSPFQSRKPARQRARRRTRATE